MLEELAGKEAADRPGRAQPLCPEGRVKLAEGSLPPREDVVAIDGLLDADGSGWWDGAVLNRVRRVGL